MFPSVQSDHITFKTIAMHFGWWGFSKRDNFFVKIIAFLFLSCGNSYCDNPHAIPKCFAKNLNEIPSIIRLTFYRKDRISRTDQLLVDQWPVWCGDRCDHWISFLSCSSSFSSSSYHFRPRRPLWNHLHNTAKCGGHLWIDPLKVRATGSGKNKSAIKIVVKWKCARKNIFYEYNTFLVVVLRTLRSNFFLREWLNTML